MHLPFTTSQFFEVFRHYNLTIWPLQLGLYALAGFATLAALRGTTPRTARLVNVILTLMWLWAGIVYQYIFFQPINPAAKLFAALFVMQAALFGWFGVFRTRLKFRPRSDWTGVAGGLLLLYALFLYPMLSYYLGHRYPATPTLGVPCPVTIFTIGMLMWAERPLLVLLIIPILWAAVGSSAAFLLGVREDLGLAVAGIFGLAVCLARTNKTLARA